MSDARRLPASSLVAWSSRVLISSGVDADDAALIADSLVDADARGRSSHGCRLLPLYLARLRRGEVDPQARPRIVRDAGAVALVDGALAFGQVAAALAVDLTVEKARGLGASVVLVRETSHFGALGYFTRRAAALGVVAIAVQNGPAMVPPYGSVTPLLGTNPLSWAVPTGDDAIEFDASLTAAAGNRLLEAREAGESTLPAGWALDAEGRPTTDVAAASEGFLAWAAGHKGFGLAMLVEVLSGPLTGGSFGTTHRSASTVRGRGRIDKGACFVAIDPSAVVPVGEFEAAAGELARQVRDAQPAAGRSAVLAPGDLERVAFARSQELGVPLDEPTVAALVAVGEDAGVPFRAG